MITRENRSHWWETCPSVTLTTINNKRSALLSNSGLCTNKAFDLLQNPKVHCRVQKILLRFPVLNYTKPNLSITSYLFRTHCRTASNLLLCVKTGRTAFSFRFTPKRMSFSFLPKVPHAPTKLSSFLGAFAKQSRKATTGFVTSKAKTNLKSQIQNIF